VRRLYGAGQWRRGRNGRVRLNWAGNAVQWTHHRLHPAARSPARAPHAPRYQHALQPAVSEEEAAAALVGLAAPPAAPCWRAPGFASDAQRAAGEAATAHGTHGPHQPCPDASSGNVCRLAAFTVSTEAESIRWEGPKVRCTVTVPGGAVGTTDVILMPDRWLQLTAAPGREGYCCITLGAWRRESPFPAPWQDAVRSACPSVEVQALQVTSCPWLPDDQLLASQRSFLVSDARLVFPEAEAWRVLLVCLPLVAHSSACAGCTCPGEAAAQGGSMPAKPWKVRVSPRGRAEEN
jgi:hypothetical protein